MHTEKTLLIKKLEDLHHMSSTFLMDFRPKNQKIVEQFRPISQKQIDPVQDNKRGLSLDIHQALQTLRKLPLFGKRHFKIDFEWPTKNELLAMHGKEIKLEGLSWELS